METGCQKKKKQGKKKDIRNHGVWFLSFDRATNNEKERERERVLGVLISHDRKNAISRPPFFSPPSHRTWLNRWFNRGRSRDSFLVFQRVECTYACTLRERERERGRGREFVEIVFPCKTGQFSFPARWPEWKSVKEQYLSFTSITAPREISNANDPSNICRLNYYTFFFFFFSSPCSDRAANFYSVAFFFFSFQWISFLDGFHLWTCGREDRFNSN